jgi:hypothetical protein
LDRWREPPIIATPVIDSTTGAVTSYQWFAGNTVCDPRIAPPAAGSCNASSVFALPYNSAGVAHFGNLPRNAMIGPGFGDTDLSIIKNVKLAGNARAQLRIEVFNLFNQVNLGLPGRTAATVTTSFGVISATRFPTGDSGSARRCSSRPSSSSRGSGLGRSRRPRGACAAHPHLRLTYTTSCVSH